MSQQGQVNNREKSMAENIVILTMVAAFMSFCMYYFFKQEQQLTTAGFKSISKTFSSRIVGIRAQWFMENQPDALTIKNEKPLIQMNKKGWVDFQTDQQNCRKVWQAVMTTELVYMKQPITVLELNQERKASRRVCRYQLTSGEFFDYHLENGVITDVKSDK